MHATTRLRNLTRTLLATAQREDGGAAAAQAAAQCTGLHGGLFGAAEARHQRCPNRLGDVVVQTASEQLEVAGVQSVHESTEVGPLVSGGVERDIAAESLARLVGADDDMGPHDRTAELARNR